MLIILSNLAVFSGVLIFLGLGYRVWQKQWKAHIHNTDMKHKAVISALQKVEAKLTTLQLNTAPQLKTDTKEDKQDTKSFDQWLREPANEQPQSLIIPKAIQPDPVPKPKAVKKEAVFDDDLPLSPMVISELLESALARKQVDTFIQPFVSLPARKVSGYEMFARIRVKAGSYMPASKFMRIAKQDGIVPLLDKYLLNQAFQAIQDLPDHEATVFLNVAAETLKDTGYMRALLEFLKRNKDLANRLVFEFSQSEQKRAWKYLQDIMGLLSKVGCRFSMDQIQDPLLHVDRLQESHIAFVKFSSPWILQEIRHDTGYAKMQNTIKKLKDANMRIIIDTLEDERDIPEILDMEPSYGQGYIFGRPDLYGSFIRQKMRKAA